MSAKFNVSTAFAVTLSRGFKLVIIVKHNFDDSSSVNVSSHVYRVSTFTFDYNLYLGFRLVSYSRCYVLLWLITYLRKSDLHARLVLQLLTGDRHMNLFKYLDVA
jgi:hypothetical protein